jgi:hypothetical protein
MILPRPTDDELVMFVVDGFHSMAVQDYIRRTMLDIRTVDFEKIHEMFLAEWDRRMDENR